MCNVCPLSTSLHFDSTSTVVTSHVVFMLSSNHTVNQKIQLGPMSVYLCIPLFAKVVNVLHQCMLHIL